MRDRLEAADVEHLAVAGIARARPQERVGRIVHVDEVAELAAVAVDLDLAVLDARRMNQAMKPWRLCLSSCRGP